MTRRTERSFTQRPPATATPAEERHSQVLSIFAEFRGALAEMRCGASQRLVRGGISMTQIHILSILEHHGEMPMSRLAEMLDVSVSNATGLIDRMEEHLLVERVRDRQDRRVVVVRPAPGGREALDEVQLMREDLVRRLLARLDDTQAERLALAMGDLRDAAIAEAAEGAGSQSRHSHPQPQPRGTHA